MAAGVPDNLECAARGVGQIFTVIATHVITDAMHVVSGATEQVLAELRRRFPAQSAAVPPGDLERLLELIGREHCIVRLSGRVPVPSATGIATGRQGKRPASPLPRRPIGVQTPTTACSADYPP